MNRLNKLIEASAIMLKELDSLRRQKREWELERANLLAEQAHLNSKVKDLAVSFTKQCFELEEAKHKMTLYHQVLTKDCEAQAQPVDDVNNLDGPDDVDVERMQSTADHDPEAMPITRMYGKDNQNE